MRLETKRLLLRPFTEDDLPYAVYLCDEETMKHVRDTLDAGSAIAFLKEHALGENPSVWALEYKETGLLLGHAVFHAAEAEDEYELGWVLDSRVWNQGVAAESGRTLIVHAFGMCGARRVCAHTAPHHGAALALIKKLGMHPCGEENGRLAFELRREDFCSCRG